MTPHPMEPPQAFDRWGHMGVCLVLVLAFVTGGGASDRGAGDVITQLIAIPMVIWAVLAVMASPANVLRSAGIAISILVTTTVAIQQLPLSEDLWRSIPARDALANNLAVAGIGDARYTWSLTPLASERGLWSILPALAVFIGALALPVRHHRRMLLLVVGLSTASLLLGFAQLGAPQDSLLNPFPEWVPALNGFFANQHHQATAMAVSVMIIASLLVHDLGREPPEIPRWARFSLSVLAIFLFVSLPLTDSRAVFVLAALGLVAVPVVLGRRRGPPATSVVKTWIVRVVLGLVALGGVVAALGWLRFDMLEEVRWAVAKATFAMGWAHAPLGAGVGSFIPWFDQAAPAVNVQASYFNHAHNEFAQWWLESGVLGAASVVAVIALLLACYPRRLSRSGGDRGTAVAAWLGCILTLAHSWVDYPLRTPALMTVAGLLAGIALSHRVARESRTVDRKPSGTDRSPRRA